MGVDEGVGDVCSEVCEALTWGRGDVLAHITAGNTQPNFAFLHPETRNLKLETRHPKPRTRNPKPETRNPNPEVLPGS